MFGNEYTAPMTFVSPDKGFTIDSFALPCEL
jgi:hypothetical protein